MTTTTHTAARTCLRQTRTRGGDRGVDRHRQRGERRLDEQEELLGRLVPEGPALRPRLQVLVELVEPLHVRLVEHGERDDHECAEQGSGEQAVAVPGGRHGTPGRTGTNQRTGEVCRCPASSRPMPRGGRTRVTPGPDRSPWLPCRGPIAPILPGGQMAPRILTGLVVLVAGCLLASGVPGPATAREDPSPTAGRVAGARDVQRPPGPRAAAVRPGPAHRHEDRPGAPWRDGPAGGVQLRDAVDEPGAAAGVPPRRRGQGGGRRALGPVGVGQDGSARSSGPARGAAASSGSATARAAGPAAPARQVRHDLEHRSGRAPGDGGLDELHRARGPRPVAGPVQRRRGPRRLPPAGAASSAAWCRTGPSPSCGCAVPVRASARRWPRCRRTTGATTRCGAGSTWCPAGARQEAPASVAGPCSGSRCTAGTATGAWRSRGPSPP